MVPQNIPEDVTVLQQPLDKTYLVSTSVMDLVRQIDAMSDIRLSGTKEDGWYVEEARKPWRKETFYMQENTVIRTMN